MTTKRGGDDNPRRPTDGRTYEIGYGRPPAGRRFVKGQSGNPSGKPKTRKSLADFVDEQLRQKVTVDTGGRRVKVPKSEIIARRMVNDAAKGDRAMIQLLQRLLAERSRSEPVVDPAADYNPDPNGPLSPEELAAFDMVAHYMDLEFKHLGIDLDVPFPGGPRS